MPMARDTTKAATLVIPPCLPGRGYFPSTTSSWRLPGRAVAIYLDTVPQAPSGGAQLLSSRTGTSARTRFSRFVSCGVEVRPVRRRRACDLQGPGTVVLVALAHSHPQVLPRIMGRSKASLIPIRVLEVRLGCGTTGVVVATQVTVGTALVRLGAVVRTSDLAAVS